MAHKYKYEELGFKLDQDENGIPGWLQYRGSKKLSQNDNLKLVEVVKESLNRELRATGEKEEDKFILVGEGINITEEE